MMNDELHKKTKDLLKQLNYFIIHVLVFMFFNALIVHAAFRHSQNRGWVLFFVGLWALALIYHGLKVYGIDIFNPKNKKFNHLWGWLKLVSGY